MTSGSVGPSLVRKVHSVKRNKISRAAVGALVFACVAACAAPSSAQSDWFGKNKVQRKQFEWYVLKTPHFDINFPGGYRDLAARTGVILEAGYEKLSNDFTHRIAWRIPVIIYGSHSDFQETNVTWSLIPEGVQAFAEPMRKRMVLHFSGSNADYAHTAVHELVHIFSYDIIYSTLLRSVFSRSMLFPIPLWFMEGVAEYYSSGYDRNAEMFMRDAAVFDYLTDLDYTGGYMAYKSGQAAIFYLNETYGPGKVIEIMDNIRNQRGSISMALESSLGITSEELSRDWKKAMRRRYWPLYADKKEPEAYGRRLTDHVKKHNGMNMKPAFSPDGQYVVYFSDLKGLDGIYLMNAVTGRVEKRLISGMMSTRFESIRSMNSNPTYSNDGTRIAFVAKSHGSDRLFVMRVPGGKILDEISIPLDFIHSPAWSPSGDTIAFVGVVKGQTDLYLYDLAGAKLTRLTDDADDEDTPSWFPDGKRIVYARSAANALQPVFAPDSAGVVRLAGVDYTASGNVHAVDSDIWSIDAGTGEKSLLIRTSGNDNNPVVIEGGEEIVFTSDEDGIDDLYRGSVAVGSYRRFTDLLGGISSFAYSKAGDRLVYSGFNVGGYDLFAMDVFTEKSKISYSTGGPALAGSAPGEAPADMASLIVPTGDSLALAADTVRAPTVTAGSDDATRRLEGAIKAEATKTHLNEPPSIGIAGRGENEVPAIVVDEDSKEDIDPDSLEAIRARVARQIGTVQRYHAGLGPDYVGNMMGIGYSTGFGFQLYNQIAFSDLLGDHHLLVAFNFFRSIEDSDVLVTYRYLKRRIDYGVGVFQFKNYLNSRVSSIGETFIDYQLFTERNYGLFAVASYPFSTFTRADLEFEGFISEREFFGTYREGSSGYEYYVPEKSKRNLLQPTFSLVHDSAYFGSFGPVIGSRWMLSASRAFAVSGDAISRTTLFADYRKYTPLFYRNYFAVRGIGALGLGDDPQIFFLGGPLTMRGYDYLQFSGSRMLLFNAEYRYPLVDAIIFGWPGRWAIQDIGGTLFFDTGSVWGKGMYVEPLPSWLEPRFVNDLAFYSDFGVGFYMRIGYLILNFQLGWPTDFSRTGDSMFHFFIGPQF
jgi:Tol biopolymer transport system component